MVVYQLSRPITIKQQNSQINVQFSTFCCNPTRQRNCKHRDYVCSRLKCCDTVQICWQVLPCIYTGQYGTVKQRTSTVLLASNCSCQRGRNVSSYSDSLMPWININTTHNDFDTPHCWKTKELIIIALRMDGWINLLPIYCKRERTAALQ